MGFKEEHKIETYRSMITVSIAGFKSLLLINGGAVVAILAYLGQTEEGPKIASHAFWPMSFFIAGTVLSIFAMICSYGTQFAVYNEEVYSSGYRGLKHMTWFQIGFYSALMSLVSFVGGSFWMLSVLSRIKDL